MDRRLVLAAKFVLLLVLAGPAQSQIYRWVDEEGKVTYSNNPPPAGVRATEIGANARGGFASVPPPPQVATPRPSPAPTVVASAPPPTPRRVEAEETYSDVFVPQVYAPVYAPRAFRRHHRHRFDDEHHHHPVSRASRERPAPLFAARPRR